MEEDEINDNYKESTLEKLDSSKDKSSNDELDEGDIENNNNMTNCNIKEVLITLTMTLPNKKIFNDKEKALEQSVIKVVVLVTN